MKYFYTTIIIAFLTTLSTYAQVAKDSYRIFLTDKNNNEYTISKPEEFLSQKAINRRLNQNINILINDLPVSKTYIDSLEKLGCQIINTSKWFNTVVIKSTNSGFLDTITKLGFVKSKEKRIKTLKTLSYKNLQKKSQKAITSTDFYDYGNATSQINLHNGHALHQKNYKGEGITIAVLDAGFYNVDKLPAFDSIINNKQILGTKDFVTGNDNVYEDSEHGMKVLSIMGGNIPGQLIGTAPKANYWLLRCENENSEYAIEEDNWVVAAEFADSIGADIINSSLGYTMFDDETQNYTYNDLDGNTSFITKAADIAASKGLIIINSAGNEGNSLWQYISAPADADSILTVGAVDKYAAYADFSSIGPTADGRIKPDIVALGFQTTLQSREGAITYGNGTSFSTPVITGLTACLWQSMPKLSNMEIIQKIKESAHQYTNPDNLLGYGVPDFARAASLTNIKPLNEKGKIKLELFPNPFNNYINIQFFTKIKNDLSIYIYDLNGKKIWKNEYPLSQKYITINNLENLTPGIYVLKIKSGNTIINKKISKL